MPTGNRFPFTMARLAKIPSPAVRVTYYDAGCPGLALRVTPAGCKTFIRAGRIKGRYCRVVLGEYPAVGVDTARDLCRQTTGQIAAGVDPTEKRPEDGFTFGQLWERWLVDAKIRKRTWKEDERLHKLFLAKWDNRPLGAIRSEQVQHLHARIGRDRGPYQANRVLALVRAMCNTAANLNGEKNPAKGIKPFKEESRDRFLTAEELGPFFESLAAEESDYRDFFELSLLTGARRGAVQSMRWNDISWEHRLWRLSADVAKNKNGDFVALVPAAVNILKDRQGKSKSQWVFPSYGKTGHIVETKSAWKRILTRAGLTNLRPHDLRRSLGSWMAMGGASMAIVGKQLTQLSPQATAVYARLSLDTVRKAAEDATSKMLAHKPAKKTIEIGGTKSIIRENVGDEPQPGASEVCPKTE